MSLRSILPALIPVLASNSTLPSLPAYQARSFYAQILLVVSVLLNVAGIDLFSVLSEMGLGSSTEEVMANGDKAVAAWQQIAPMVFGLWAWIERRAPNYRLVWWGSKVSTNTVKSWIFVLLLMGLAYAAAPQAGIAGIGPRGLV